MKRATRRRIAGIGHLARQQNALLLSFGIWIGHRGQKRLGIRMGGTLKKLINRSQFHNLTDIHHRHAVGNMAHHTQIVGDKQIGQTKLFLQLLKQIEHLRLHRDIQRGNGFVRHNQLGM